MYIFLLERLNYGTEFKQGSAIRPTNMIQSPCFSGNSISLFSSIDIYSATLPEFLPEDDHRTSYWRKWGTCGRMEKTKRMPLNNIDLKSEERPCTIEYLPPLGFEKGTR